MPKNDKREGVRGYLVNRHWETKPDKNGEERCVIVITIKTCEGKKYELDNNWDAPPPKNDGTHQERWKKATKLMNKKVKTIVWGNYKADKWWCDLKEVKK